MIFPRLTPLIRQALILLFAVYISELVLQNWFQVPVFELLALQHSALGLHTAWQVMSYVLVVPTSPQYVLGFLISMVFLWWIMAPFEERYGKKRAGQLMGVAALSASLPALLVAQLAPQSADYPPLFGTGPILLSGIASFAYALRGLGSLSLFGAIQMKPIHIIWLSLGLSVLFFLASGNFIELSADLGAVGGGILFIRFISRPRNRTGGGKKRSSKAPRFRVVAGGQSDDGPKSWLN